MKIGIIGGSGLYHIEGFSNQKWVKVRTPFGAPSDELLTGELAGREVVFLPRHARGHRILPSELNHRANLWAMKKLGVAWIISVSAVGSLQAKYKPRDIVLVNQFLDRTKQDFEHTFFGRGIVAHVAFAHPICEELRRLLLKSARKLKARVHDGGTYVNMEGPAFSTRAESLTNRKLGYDVIGMTNLGEAKCAREAEIAYATMAMVTDYDCWKEDEAHVTVELVIANLMRNVDMAKAIIRDVIPQIPQEANWPCHSALRNAIMTDKQLWPAKTRRELAPILAKYPLSRSSRRQEAHFEDRSADDAERQNWSLLTSAATVTRHGPFLSDPLLHTRGMKVNFFRQDPDAEREVLAVFGEARLVKLFCGRLELRGGSAADRVAAKEWISLFMHDAVPRIVADRRVAA